jgi:hypothetical protein
VAVISQQWRRAIPSKFLVESFGSDVIMLHIFLFRQNFTVNMCIGEILMDKYSLGYAPPRKNNDFRLLMGDLK